MRGLDWVATVFVGVIGAGVAAPFDVAAVQLEAHASVTPSVVPLNGQFTLAVEVRGTNQMDVEPSLPDLGDFSRYLGRNSSTSMQMINGVTTVSLVIQYRYRAIREGTFEIGVVEVEAGGQVLRTQPVTLTVSTAGAAAGGGSGPENPTGVGPDDLFIVAEVGKTRVYQNEPIEVSYRLFTRVNVTSFTLVDLGESEGFWVEEVPGPQSPEVEQRVRGGQPYTTAVVGASSSFPGARDQDHRAAEASRPACGFGGRREAFSMTSSAGVRLFGSQVPAVIVSDPVEVVVLPLPVEGRPQSFTGLVGRLNVSASIDRSNVETNDAVTLGADRRGRG